MPHAHDDYDNDNDDEVHLQAANAALGILVYIAFAVLVTIGCWIRDTVTDGFVGFIQVPRILLATAAIVFVVHKLLDTMIPNWR
jgi:hypothetical protein